MFRDLEMFGDARKGRTAETVDEEEEAKQADDQCSANEWMRPWALVATCVAA